MIIDGLHTYSPVPFQRYVHTSLKVEAIHVIGVVGTAVPGVLRKIAVILLTRLIVALRSTPVEEG